MIHLTCAFCAFLRNFLAHNENNPARCCGRNTVHTSSGHLVLAKLLPGFWFHPNWTLLSRVFLSGGIAGDVVARHLRLAVAP